MSKRKPLDKAQARERRNRLLQSAAAAELSIKEGVREMRAISGMTQEEFARHREVSARVIKAIELGQGNPTVATLNRIGQFFGLELAFVPATRMRADSDAESPPGIANTDEPKEGRSEQFRELAEDMTSDVVAGAVAAREEALRIMRHLDGVLVDLDARLERIAQKRDRKTAAKPAPALGKNRKSPTS